MPPINSKTWDIFSAEEKKDLKKARAERRKKHGLQGQFDVFIACVARNQRRKNLPVLFESLKVLKEAHKINPLLMLVAHGAKTPSGNFAGWDLDHLVKHFGVEENVFVAGRTDGKILHDEAVAQIYLMADMFALPTMGEGFGLIFGEAMYAGLPVVTTDYSACTEVVAHRGVLVKPTAFVWDMDNTKEAIVSAEDFAQGIVDVMDASDRTKDSWKTNQEAFLRQQNPELVAESLLAVMRRAVEEDVQCLAFKDKIKEDTKKTLTDN
jgi:glycosyltransferase involved in cell wall biosynthesis